MKFKLSITELNLCSVMENTYKYMLIDGSYFLTRNFMVLKNYDDFSFSKLARSFIQSIVKIFREFDTADKVIIAWDKWDLSSGGYFRNKLIDNYKGDRVYETEAGLQALKDNPDSTQEDIKTYERNLKCNKIKREVKSWIMDELSKFGMPSISLPGWEADDIARVFCETLSNDTKKSCIVSKDSDWTYLINPNVEFMSGKDGEVITYEDMLDKSLPDRLPLWQYKALEDALYGSHNNMMNSIDKKLVRGKKHKKIIEEVLDGNLDFIEDIDLYHNNLKTFDIETFDDYPNLVNLLKSIDAIGSVSEKYEFIKMSKDKQLWLTVDYYWDDFIYYLNPDLYETKKNSKVTTDIDIDFSEFM